MKNTPHITAQQTIQAVKRKVLETYVYRPSRKENTVSGSSSSSMLFPPRRYCRSEPTDEPLTAELKRERRS